MNNSEKNLFTLSLERDPPSGGLNDNSYSKVAFEGGQSF